MLFNSHVFIFCFLPVVLMIFRALANQRFNSLSLLWLTLASAIYYAWWQPKYLLLLLFSTATNYSGALFIEYFYKNKNFFVKNLIVVLMVFFNLGLLGYFKYVGFIIDIFNSMGITSLTPHAIVLPLAISFYTFEQLGYIFDVASGFPAERRVLNYSLFALFFPRLIAGPIVQSRWIFPLFDRFKTFTLDYKSLCLGVSLFAIGLFKKSAIADNIAPFANFFYNGAKDGNLSTVFDTWLGMFSYTFQLYFDFSGYSDMAIGLSLLFGIELPQNFNSPYQAKNIREFWQKWHITLGEFLTNYLYKPLVLLLLTKAEKFSKIEKYFNVFISAFASFVTMVISGIWHGAGWNFVAFGILHGFFFLLLHVWEIFAADLIFTAKIIDIFRKFLTFICVVVGWVFFRSENFTTAKNIIKVAFYGHNTSFLPENPNWLLVFFLIILLGIVNFAPNSQTIIAFLDRSLIENEKFRKESKYPSWVSSAFVMSFIFAIGLLYLGDSAVFLYFNF